MIREENLYLNGKVSTEELLLYIKGELKEERMKEIEFILKSSKDDFKQYVFLKEYLYFQGENIKPSAEFKESILALVKKQSFIPHLQLLIKLLKDKVSVSSSDQEILEFQGIMTDFAFRGSEPGPISITRKVNGNDVTLTFTPTNNGKNYLLNVTFSNSEFVRVILSIDDVEWEIIRNLSEKSLFDSQLPLQGDMELVFKKNADTLFTIGISLHNDK
jgi:hypothetical protein